MILTIISNFEAAAARLMAAPVTIKAASTVLVTKGVIYMQGLVRQEEPIRTGRLRNATTYEMLPPAGNTVAGRVVAEDDRAGLGVKYAVFVHQGTGQYALDQSKTSGRIKHGGIKPNQFMDRALKSSTPTIDILARAAADEIMRAL